MRVDSGNTEDGLVWGYANEALPGDSCNNGGKALQRMIHCFP